jgi:S-adenosylmethionine-diacylgycerolhomoserine-N-methlytransferase
MSILSDVRTLYHLALTPIRGQTHADRLESFYRGQATSYDAFRQRLLPGRDELMRLQNAS